MKSNNSKSDYHCWNFIKDEEVPYPSLNIIVRNFKNKNFLAIETKIDTGFNGVVGLTSNQLSELNIKSEGSTVVKTAGGERIVKFFKIQFSIPNTQFTDIKGVGIETPRSVIGRSILNLASWLYDGIHQEWCLIENVKRRSTTIFKN
ncbi:MAG: hypothetical protein HeimC3_48220 [Candidatus Heimdallarchaeota archaeon LC_3]|nr:MAG: hypothetical protein HeimC3_48220 [Candidatus Heimdallarchaeota archaeon LC_3]